ncbi:MAG: hypothetical protein HF967_02140, partial [Methanosarcinales archaeon]|nr:hypothetical protein [Methanosarcinales archaeon]
SMGVADVGVMSDNGRAFGFILKSEPSTDLLNASVNNAINESIEKINGTTVGGQLLNFGSPECNGTRLLGLYETFSKEPALIQGLMDAHKEELGALLKLNAEVQKVSGLKDHWNTYLIDLNLQEFRTRRDTFGTESFYFYTLEEPSPIESSFINYMRLKVFGA